MFNSNRYVSRGVINEIPIEIQLFMWNLIELMPVEEKDYLQIFNLSPKNNYGVNIQQIIHHQEQPEYRKIHIYN